MTAKVIRADYDVLSQMAGIFTQQAQQAHQILRQLNREMDGLQGGDWLGQGAQAFYAEMNGQILPSMNRLVRALEAAGDVTRQVSQIAQQAEKEAAAFLRLDGNGNGAGAAIGAAAAGLGAAGTLSSAEMDVGDGVPDGSSALWKPGQKNAGGGSASKKPRVTVSAQAKHRANIALDELRQYRPQLAKAIEKDPALRSLLEQVTRAGYDVVPGKPEFDEPGLTVWVGPDTTVESFKNMARQAIDHPRILSNIDPKAAAAIKKNPALLERVLDWGDPVDGNSLTNLEMGTGPLAEIRQGRNGTGTTIAIDPKDPAGSLARALDRIERGK